MGVAVGLTIAIAVIAVPGASPFYVSAGTSAASVDHQVPGGESACLVC
jgi:hypothetical protein